MKKWIKTNERLVYDGYRKIIRKTFTLPNGKSDDFDIVKTNGGVGVLTLTTENKVVCFKQFRPGPESILYEIPGGAIDGDEKPIAAAKRELLEETGYEADIKFIGSYYRDAYITGKWLMFVGLNAKKVNKQKLDITEFGDVVLLSLPEFKEYLFSGLMTDTTLGYAGLHYLDLL